MRRSSFCEGGLNCCWADYRRIEVHVSSSLLASAHVRQTHGMSKWVYLVLPALWVGVHIAVLCALSMFPNDLNTSPLSGHFKVGGHLPVFLFWTLLASQFLLFVYLRQANPGWPPLSSSEAPQAPQALPPSEGLVDESQGLLSRVSDAGVGSSSSNKGDEGHVRGMCSACGALQVQHAAMKHCNLCGRCVLFWDHHCYVIGSCIGQRNHGPFWLFLLNQVVLIMLAFHFTLSAVGIPIEGVLVIMLSFHFVLSAVGLRIEGVSSKTEQRLYGLQTFLLLFLALALIVAGMLLVMHSALAVMGVTTRHLIHRWLGRGALNKPIPRLTSATMVRNVCNFFTGQRDGTGWLEFGREAGRSKGWLGAVEFLFDNQYYSCF
eukprot:gene11452-34162_t